jgi:hypothetical protein
VLIGAFFASLVADKVGDVLRTWLGDAGIAADELPYPFRPDVLAQMALWIIDTAQVFTAILSPAVGLVLLVAVGASKDVALAYLGALVAAFAIFTRFYRHRPDDYGRNVPSGLGTPIFWICFLVNLVGAAAAAAIGP